MVMAISAALVAPMRSPIAGKPKKMMNSCTRNGVLRMIST